MRSRPGLEDALAERLETVYLVVECEGEEALVGPEAQEAEVIPRVERVPLERGGGRVERVVPRVLYRERDGRTEVERERGREVVALPGCICACVNKRERVRAREQP